MQALKSEFFFNIWLLMKFLLFSVYIFFPSRILECSSSSTSMSTEEKDFYCSSFISPLTGLASTSPPFQTDKHCVTIPFAFLWHIKKKIKIIPWLSSG